MVSELNLLRGKLKTIWGYDDFRYPQSQVMESLLAKKRLSGGDAYGGR